MFLDSIIERKVKYYSKLAQEVFPLIYLKDTDELMSHFLQVEGDILRDVSVISRFIDQSREKDYFKKLYEQIKGKEFNSDTLRELKPYKLQENNVDSLAGLINIALNSVDFNLSTFITPLRSMPSHYTTGKLESNCQAVSHISTILYSYENDVNDLEFGSCLSTDRRDYFLNLIKDYKDLKDYYFYVVDGKHIMSHEDPDYSLEKIFLEMLKSNTKEEKSHIQSSGRGSDLKSQVLKMALSLEEPHAVIKNTRTNDEYDAYYGENRVLQLMPLKEGIYNITKLNIFFIQNFFCKKNNLKKEYEKMLLETKKIEPTLLLAGWNFTTGIDESLDYLEKANKFYTERGINVPAKQIVMELATLKEKSRYCNQVKKEIIPRIEYLKETYILPNALEIISEQYGIDITKMHK